MEHMDGCLTDKRENEAESDLNALDLERQENFFRQAGEHHPAVRTLPSRRGETVLRRQYNQFLPTLFDRLSDDAPYQSKEGAHAYAPTRKQMREIVQRDLFLLLNTISQDELLDAKRHKEVMTSSINYGLPALAGSYLSGHRWNDIEKIVHNAILRYEPRLLPDSIVVKPVSQEKERSKYNVIQFEISAMLFMVPYPVEFTVQSSVGLETGLVTVKQV